jgi:hypothetical protein
MMRVAAWLPPEARRRLGYRGLAPSTVTGLARALAGAGHASAHVAMRIRRARLQAPRPQHCTPLFGLPATVLVL